jgi:hypothetical protein
MTEASHLYAPQAGGTEVGHLLSSLIVWIAVVWQPFDYRAPSSRPRTSGSRRHPLAMNVQRLLPNGVQVAQYRHA